MDELRKLIEEIKYNKNSSVVVAEIKSNKNSKEDTIQESFTIRRSDLERLGLDLMKELYSYLHSEETISYFPELKLEQEKFDKLVNKNDNLNIEKMFHIFLSLDLENERDGDLYYKIKGYEDLFRVLSVNYTYLEH